MPADSLGRWRSICLKDLSAEDGTSALQIYRRMTEHLPYRFFRTLRQEGQQVEFDPVLLDYFYSP